MISFVLVISIIILVFILFFLDLQNKKRYLLKLGNVKCNYLPLIGSVHNFFPKGLSYIYEWISSEESSQLLWIFSIPVFYTRRPEELQTIFLNKNSLSKASAYEFIKPFKDSIGIADVQTWKPRRRLLNRCFKQKQIQDLVPQYNDSANLVMNKITSEMTLEQLSEMFRSGVLNLFFGTLTSSGTKDTYSSIKFDFYTTVRTLERTVVKRFVSPWLYPNFIFSQTDLGKEFKSAMNALYQDSTKLYEYMKKKQSMNLQVDTEANEKQDFVNIILGDYEAEESKSEISLFVIAAENTAGTTLTLTLLLLGIYQDVQEKLYNEVIELLGPDNPVETEHLSKLKYTLMVIFETLRLFPPTGYVGRQADEDINLGGGRLIPKGTQIILSLKDLHRDEKLWKEPNKFVPERFSSEEVEKRHPCCFLPFSYGPRNCIAYKFAETVMRVYVANIVRKYRITSSCRSVEDIVLPNAIFVHLPNFKVKFEKR